MELPTENAKPIINQNYDIPFYKKKVFIISLIVSITIIVIISVVLAILLTKEKMCEQSNDTHCRKCDTEHKSQCAECYDGYYMPSDDPEKKICKKCTFKNCYQCSGTSNSQECLKCELYKYPIYKNGTIEECSNCDKGEGNKCLTCQELSDECFTCNPGYIQRGGRCYLFYIEAEYETTNDNETVYLISNTSLEISMDIVINGTRKNLITNEYTFEKSGIHAVTLLSPKVATLQGLFENNENLISASIIHNYPHYDDFNKLENTFAGAKKLVSANISKINVGKLETVENLFKDCHSLKTVVFPKYFNILRKFNGMFQNCYSLTSIDFSNIILPESSQIYMNNAFENCTNLKYISFENSNFRLVNVASMFRGCSSLTSLNISNFIFQGVRHNRVNYMFYGCSKLSLIDISSLVCSSYSNIHIFDILPDEGIIAINKDLLEVINETIPDKWDIIVK